MDDSASSTDWIFLIGSGMYAMGALVVLFWFGNPPVSAPLQKGDDGFA